MMTANEMQKTSIEVLKKFNNAIVTSRLYPPESPQVRTALERGYKGVKNFLRQFGSLEFSLVDDMPHLCGQSLSEEILNSFANLVIYRQLRLLQLPVLRLDSQMDRFAFSQLIIVFNAAAAKIKQEGGGLYYVTGLGLASYFPEEEDNKAKTAVKPVPAQATRKPQLAKVRPELLLALLGKDDRATIQDELRKAVNDPKLGGEVIFAGIVHLLGTMKKQRGFRLSSGITELIRRLDTLIAPERIEEAALQVAGLLTASLKNSAIYVLLSQQLESLFGNSLYQAIVTTLDHSRLGEIFIIGREHCAKAKETEHADSEVVAQLDKAFLRLMNTEQGKRFLGSEKAKTIIHTGEEERRKKRIAVGMAALLQQDRGALRNRELLEYLPRATRLYLKNNEQEKVELIVRQLGQYLVEDRSLNQALAIAAAGRVGALLIPEKLPLLDLLLDNLKVALLGLKTAVGGIEEVVDFLHQVMQQSWQKGDNERGDEVLRLFYDVRMGAKAVPESLRNIFAKVQDRGINRAMLPDLLNRCLISPNDRELANRLILQGPVAARFLIESLINAEKRNERMVILDLLTSQEIALPMMIHERLSENMPWYGKRNLLKLLGDSGGEKDAVHIIPYLRHEDVRVQREAFLALYKVSGKQRKKMLLKGLGEASETVMLQIISALGQYCDDEVATQLSDLLQAHEYFSDQRRNELLLEILHTLGRCPNTIALQGVETFLNSKGRKESRKLDDALWRVAKEAGQFLTAELQRQTKKQHHQATQLRKLALQQAAQVKVERLDQRVVTGSLQEKNIRALISQKKFDAAGLELLNLIQQVAKLRHFGQAEKLREWLIDLDSSAFSRIIKAAEIIEREKVAAVDKGHLEIWSDLYDLLSPLEFSDIYHVLRHYNFENDDVIVRQGSINNGLFFINKGRVKLFFNDQEDEIIVQTLAQGEIFGAGTFFQPSVWTLSVAAIDNVNLSRLDLEDLNVLQEKHPGLEHELEQFCQRFEKLDAIVEKNERGRRMYERFDICGKGTMELVDHRGAVIGVSSRIELLDISLGGVFFLIKINARENARKLLGRKARLTIDDKEGFSPTLVVQGTILAARLKIGGGGDYSLHLKFDDNIRRDQLDDVIKVRRKELNDS
jgi:CRP-like cAMP-binding protein